MGQGSAPDPAGGVYSVPPDHLLLGSGLPAHPQEPQPLPLQEPRLRFRSLQPSDSKNSFDPFALFLQLVYWINSAAVQKVGCPSTSFGLATDLYTCAALKTHLFCVSESAAHFTDNCYFAICKLP